MDRSDAQRLDEEDPLAGFRERFVIADSDDEQPALIYLDGNSLGRLPKQTLDALHQTIEHEWGRGLVRSWDHWVDLPTTVGDELGAAFLGAAPGQTAIADSTTVNLAKLAEAALADRPHKTILTTRDNFPTDRYLFEHIARDGVRYLDHEAPTAAQIAEATSDGTVGLVSLSHVSYKSGALLDAAAITAAAHANRTPVLWDLSHSAGAVPVRLDAWDVDFAAGCSYKYLNGGPGSPAFLYVNRRHHQTKNPIPGWFGAADQFAMGPSYEPAPGIRRFLSGTPHVLGLVAVREGVRLAAEAGIDRIAAKGSKLTDFAIRLHDEWLAPRGVTLGTPRDLTQRGHHIALRHPQARAITTDLIEHHNVVPDFREPDIVRIGLSPLTTTFEKVWEAMAILRDHPLLSRPSR